MLFLCVLSIFYTDTLEKEEMYINKVFKPSEQFICITYIVHREAGKTDYKARRAVYDVILNRMQIKHKTACQVVAEPRQFSTYRPVKNMIVTNKMLTDMLIVRNMQPVVPEALFFHAQWAHPHWKNVVRLGNIGGNIFYRKS